MMARSSTPAMAAESNLVKLRGADPVDGLNFSQSGHDTYNAREGQHDDLILAVSMAYWYRDDISQHYDDAIADQQQRAAAEAARAERVGRLANR